MRYINVLLACLLTYLSYLLTDGRKGDGFTDTLHFVGILFLLPIIIIIIIILFFPFLSFGVTMDAEAGMTAHSQR